MVEDRTEKSELDFLWSLESFFGWMDCGVSHVLKATKTSAELSYLIQTSDSVASSSHDYCLPVTLPLR